MKYVLYLIILSTFVSCEQKQALTAQQIIDKAIAISCSGNCEMAQIEFTFRDKNYKSFRKGSEYSLERAFTDSLVHFKDVLSNDGFERYVNEKRRTLADSTSQKLSDDVNSVHYFAQLPYGLNAPAVKKEKVGEITINGTPYYEIAVYFTEEGGGTDFEDQFMYWISKESFKVDYLAYSYAVNGGGIRFREAYNERRVEGIRFVDYNNYKPENLNTELRALPNLLENGKLKLLSKIETKDVIVTLHNAN